MKFLQSWPETKRITNKHTVETNYRWQGRIMKGQRAPPLSDGKASPPLRNLHPYMIILILFNFNSTHTRFCSCMTFLFGHVCINQSFYFLFSKLRQKDRVIKIASANHCGPTALLKPLCQLSLWEETKVPGGTKVPGENRRTLAQFYVRYYLLKL